MWRWLQGFWSWLSSMRGAHRVDIEAVTDGWKGLSSKIDAERERVAQSLALALDAAQMGQWDLDLVFDTTRRSLRHDQIFGYDSLQPAWGWQDFLSHVLPEDRHAIAENFRSATRNGRALDVECRIVWPDQSIHWIAVRGRAYLDEQGEPVRMAGVIMDITERKRLEARFRATVESAPTAMVMVDAKGTIVMVNAETEKLFGYSRDAMIGEPVEMLVPERFRKGHPDLRRGFFAHPESRRMGAGRDLFGLRNDGSEFPVEIGLNPVETEEGLFVLSAVVDITERMRATESLRERDLRIRSLLDSTAEGIYGLDLSGNCTFANAASAELLGYNSPDDFLGKNMHDLIHHTRPDGTFYPMKECRIYEAFREGRGVHVNDEVLWRKDGTSFPSEYWSYPVRRDEETVGSVVTFLDITERKRAEDALRQARDELEQRVQERTAELEHSNWELLRSNQELDDFAYIASHDLKEPLRGIHNYASFLAEDYGDVLDGEGLSKLKTLQRLSQRLEALIDSLLNYSRVGRVDLAFEQTNLNEVVSDVLDSLHIRVEEEGLDVRIPRPLPTIRCDHVRVREIYHNLISNAIKYNDKPNKWIEIGYREAKPTDPHVDAKDRASRMTPATVFYVKDNGIGIREKHCSSIFRIFKRLHARDQFGGGTGVGLTIVKKSVERHDGAVWVESEHGRGSTFYFSLLATHTPQDQLEESVEATKSHEEATQ